MHDIHLILILNYRTSKNATDTAHSKVADLMSNFQNKKNRDIMKPVDELQQESATYIAVWQDGRLCFFDNCNNLLFKSNSKVDLYNHFTEVIYDIYLKKFDLCQNVHGSLSLNKNQQTLFSLNIDGFEDLYSKYAKMMNYLWCQSEI